MRLIIGLLLVFSAFSQISNNNGAGGTGGTFHASGTTITGPLICYSTTVSGTAQSCTTSPSFTVAAGNMFVYATNTANTGSLTITVNGTTGVVKKWLGAATLDPGDVPIFKPVVMTFDGTYFLIHSVGNNHINDNGTILTMTLPSLTTNAGTGFNFGASQPWPNFGIVDINVGNMPSTVLVSNAKHIAALRAQIYLPVQAGGSSIVPMGAALYAQNGNVGGAAFGVFSNASAGNSSQLLTGANFTVSDCMAKRCPQGVTHYPAISTTGVESDMITSDSGTGIAVGFSFFHSPTTTYQAFNSAGFYSSKGGSTLGTLVFHGAGPNDVTMPNADFDGNGPGGRLYDVYGLGIQSQGHGTPDLFSWSTFIDPTTCQAGPCSTGPDFVLGGGNTLTSAASHYFTQGDETGSGTAKVQLLSCTGAGVPGTYSVTSTSGGVATLGGSPGTSGTCTAAVWQATNVPLTTIDTDIWMIQQTDSDIAFNLNGATIRPLATPYALNFQAHTNTNSHTAGDSWSAVLNYVPPVHYFSRARHGSVDIASYYEAMYTGPNMPAVGIRFGPTDQNGTPRILGLYGSPGTSTGNLVFWHPNSANSMFVLEKGNNCEYLICANLWRIDNQGTASIAGGFLPSASTTLITYNGSLTSLSAATSYLTGCALSGGGPGMQGNCMINATIIRTGQPASATDPLDTAANVVATINSQNSNMCRTGMTFTTTYQNAGSVPISVSASSGITFVPSGTVSVPVNYTLQLGATITNCGTAAITMTKSLTPTDNPVVSVAGETGVITDVMTAASAASVANKTCVSSGATRSCTYISFPDVGPPIPVAACVNATATPLINMPASSFTAACRAGANNLTGVFSATPSTGASAQIDYEWPGDADTTSQPFVSIYYGSGANTSGTVIWTVSTACMGAGAGATSDNGAFVAESAFATQTMAVASRSWKSSGQLTQLTSGNSCVPGSNYIIKIVLSGTASSAISLEKIVVTTPRLLQVQAN